MCLFYKIVCYYFRQKKCQFCWYHLMIHALIHKYATALILAWCILFKNGNYLPFVLWFQPPLLPLPQSFPRWEKSWRIYRALYCCMLVKHGQSASVICEVTVKNTLDRQRKNWWDHFSRRGQKLNVLKKLNVGSQEFLGMLWGKYTWKLGNNWQTWWEKS